MEHSRALVCRKFNILIYPALLVRGEEKPRVMRLSGLEHIIARVDMPLALSLANAAVGRTPAPAITFHMIQQARILASIAGAGGSNVHLLPIYAAGIAQDRHAFVALFYSLLTQADAVLSSN